jgi:hypothetical protein
MTGRYVSAILSFKLIKAKRASDDNKSPRTGYRNTCLAYINTKYFLDKNIEIKMTQTNKQKTQRKVG